MNGRSWIAGIGWVVASLGFGCQNSEIDPELEAGSAKPAKGPEEEVPQVGELIYVTSFDVPQAHLEGTPLTVTFRGTLPTPAWQFEGCDVTRSEGERQEIRIAPKALPPPSDVMSVQVLAPIEESVVLEGLEQGVCRIAFESRSEADRSFRELQVLPTETLAFLTVRGGVAGLHRRSLVLSDGTTRRWSKRRPEVKEGTLTPDDRMAALVAAVKALPADEGEELSRKGADLMIYQLSWNDSGVLRHRTLDDGTMREPYLEVIRELRNLW